jgi:integrase
LRNCELRALRWSDIHLMAGTLSVRRTATRNAFGKHVIGPTKTCASFLSPALAERLKNRRHAQRSEAMKAGEGSSDELPVLPNATGDIALREASL